MPTVSVIIPAYCCEKTIEQAIRSVLTQTISDLEIIVVDDCSTDNTCQIVEKVMNEDNRVILVRKIKNEGVATTRNIGCFLAKGEYIAFIGSDDWWLERKLEQQIVRMKNTDADLCYTSYYIISEDKKAKSLYIVPENIDYEGLLKENVIGCSTVLLRSELMRKYDFKDFFHEDYVQLHFL